MKTKLLLFGLALFGLAFTACSDDDDDINPSAVPESITQAFKAKYPTVTNPQWDREGSFYVAEWIEGNGSREFEAWFRQGTQASSSWAMTNTDYGKDLFMVPAGLNQSFNKTHYATYRIDDIDLYEYPDASRDMYVIEVNAPNTTVDSLVVFSKVDYTFLKAVQEPIGGITPDTVL